MAEWPKHTHFWLGSGPPGPPYSIPSCVTVIFQLRFLLHLTEVALSMVISLCLFVCFNVYSKRPPAKATSSRVWQDVWGAAVEPGVGRSGTGWVWSGTVYQVAVLVRGWHVSLVLCSLRCHLCTATRRWCNITISSSWQSFGKVLLNNAGLVVSCKQRRRQNFAPGGHGRMAHGFWSSWWQSHPQLKAIWR